MNIYFFLVICSCVNRNTCWVTITLIISDNKIKKYSFPSYPIENYFFEIVLREYYITEFAHTHTHAHTEFNQCCLCLYLLRADYLRFDNLSESYLWQKTIFPISAAMEMRWEPCEIPLIHDSMSTGAIIIQDMFRQPISLSQIEHTVSQQTSWVFPVTIFLLFHDVP